jgi:hypothetical protein
MAMTSLPGPPGAPGAVAVTSELITDIRQSGFSGNWTADMADLKVSDSFSIW